MHLHRADYSHCVARHRATASRTWNEHDLLTNSGFQNRLVEGDDFETGVRRGLDNRERELDPRSSEGHPVNVLVVPTNRPDRIVQFLDEWRPWPGE